MRMVNLFAVIVSFGLLAFAVVQYRLTLNLIDMTPHIDQMLQERVIDRTLDEEAGRKTLLGIPGSDFQVSFLTLLEEHDYRIDFYTDHDENGGYESSPDDHAWRLLLDNAGTDPVWNGYLNHLTYITSDSIVMASNNRTGSTTVFHGDLHESVIALDCGGITLDQNMNFGPSQLIMTRDMSGAFTANGVVWRIKKSETVIGPVPVGNRPNQFILCQNFTNSFNPKTTTASTILEAQSVLKKVNNLNDIEIRILVAGLRGARAHQLHF